MTETINLYEYQNKVKFKDSSDKLEKFLDEIWNKRDKSGFNYNSNQNDKIEVQQFIQFLRNSDEIKSNKYVGVIHFEGKNINLLPKIFYDNKLDTENDVNTIQNHILWWLSYCRKIKFPNYQTSLGSAKSDFFEVLIYMFSKYTRELLSNTIFQKYEDVENELSFIKGGLNTSEYINNNISKGRWHKLNCRYDEFVIDNKFNRIIKYVANQLFKVSQQNKKYLSEILFILDEVSDVPATAEDCLNINFNPIFGDFETVRDYCHLFLKNSVSFNYKNDLKLFAFLLPMEYVFEDFIFGFIDKEIEEVKAKSQSSQKSLDTKGIYSLKPDFLIEIGKKRIIADSKYKIVYSDEKDPKKGISQNDLYQMLAYAVRFKINEVKLFYPCTLINPYHKEVCEIIITDELANNTDINIKAFQLPIINLELFENGKNENKKISELFAGTRIELINRLIEIFEIPYI